MSQKLSTSEAKGVQTPNEKRAVEAQRRTTTATTSSSSASSVLFPRAFECQHFHYENIYFSSFSVQLLLNTTSSAQQSNLYCCRVRCHDNHWTISRSVEEWQHLDALLHTCLLCREVSRLNGVNASSLAQYVSRLNAILESKTTLLAFNCVLCLNWFEVDNTGRHTLSGHSEVNVRAIGAAFVVKQYCWDTSSRTTGQNRSAPVVAKAPVVQSDAERVLLSLEIGELISIIELNSIIEENSSSQTDNDNDDDDHRGRPERHCAQRRLWSKGKKGVQVGFFPSECVRLIDQKTCLPFDRYFLTRVDNNDVRTTTTTTTTTAVAVRTKRRQPATSSSGNRIASFFQKLVSHERHVQTARADALRSSAALRQRPVFGCDLSEHLFESGLHVPSVLCVCTKFIESKGLLDGIYRLSGIASNISKLRQQLDDHLLPDLCNDPHVASDPHCVSSLLKLYFRQLPRPLLTFHLYDAFVECVRTTTGDDSSEQRLPQIRRLVRRLPPPHFRTLRALIKHLSRVSNAWHVTGMTAKNLAIVWAPNLLRSRDIEMRSVGGDLAALQVIGIQAVLTEYLIEKCQQIFDDTDDDDIGLTTDSCAAAPVNAKETNCEFEESSHSTDRHLSSVDCVPIDQTTGDDMKRTCLRISRRRRASEERTESARRILASNSFESFFAKRERKMKANVRKGGVGKEDELAMAFCRKGLPEVSATCPPLVLFHSTSAQLQPIFETAVVWSTTAEAECRPVVTTRAEATLACRPLVVRTCVARNDSIEVKQTVCVCAKHSDDNDDRQQPMATTAVVPLLSDSERRERIERIKAERRQQLRQQFCANSRESAPSKQKPIPTPRKNSSVPLKLRQICAKVDTRRTTTVPVPAVRRRNSCDVVQTAVVTTGATTTPTTVRITTLKTSSKSKHNNWNKNVLQNFELN